MALRLARTARMRASNTGERTGEHHLRVGKRQDGDHHRELAAQMSLGFHVHHFSSKIALRITFFPIDRFWVLFVLYFFQ